MPDFFEKITSDAHGNVGSIHGPLRQRCLPERTRPVNREAKLEDTSGPLRNDRGVSGKISKPAIKASAGDGLELADSKNTSNRSLSTASTTGYRPQSNVLIDKEIITKAPSTVREGVDQAELISTAPIPVSRDEIISDGNPAPFLSTSQADDNMGGPSQDNIAPVEPKESRDNEKNAVTIDPSQEGRAGHSAVNAANKTDDMTGVSPTDRTEVDARQIMHFEHFSATSREEHDAYPFHDNRHQKESGQAIDAREPLVHIGQIDIIIEAPTEPPSNKATTSVKGSQSLNVSASFLRRL